MIVLLALDAVAAPPSTTRSAAEFLVTQVGASWTYDGPLGPAETVTISSRGPESALQVTNVDQNGQASVMTWSLVDGAWMEQLAARGPTPIVVLPAKLTKGTTWEYSYTDLLGGTGTHRFVVASLSESVTLRNGATETGCLEVREFRPDLGPDLPVVHWYAAGRGEVGARIGDSWFRSLSSFTPGPALR